MQKLKKYFKKSAPKDFAIVGGASANLLLRSQVEELCGQYGTTLHLAPLKFCSDNAAMIGRVAVEQYKAGDFTSIDDVDINSRVKVM